jgi:hypothetical protein
MGVVRTFSEKGFLCHGEVNFDLEPLSTREKMKAEKEMEENDIGGS